MYSPSTGFTPDLKGRGSRPASPIDKIINKNNLLITGGSDTHKLVLGKKGLSKNQYKKLIRKMDLYENSILSK